jgi:hypothetical protein
MHIVLEIQHIGPLCFYSACFHNSIFLVVFTHSLLFHDADSYKPASHCGGPGSFPEYFMRNLCGQNGARVVFSLTI